MSLSRKITCVEAIRLSRANELTFTRRTRRNRTLRAKLPKREWPNSTPRDTLTPPTRQNSASVARVAWPIGRPTGLRRCASRWPAASSKARTLDEYGDLLNCYILPELGHVRIAAITPGQLEQMIGSLATANKFSGEIDCVQIDLGDDSHFHVIKPEDRLTIVMARQ
jgi:hypothetical protein